MVTALKFLRKDFTLDMIATYKSLENIKTFCFAELKAPYNLQITNRELLTIEIFRKIHIGDFLLIRK